MVRLSAYPNLQYFLKGNTRWEEECALYKWIEKKFDLVDLLERKLGILKNKGILDSQKEKRERWKGDILYARGESEHKLFEVLSEIDWAATLAEAGFIPELDVQLPNDKSLDLKVTLLHRPIYFEINTKREEQDEESNRKGRILKYFEERLAHINNSLCGRRIYSVRLENFTPYYFPRENPILSENEMDQLLRLIKEDIRSISDDVQELRYYLDQCEGQFKRCTEHEYAKYLPPELQKEIGYLRVVIRLASFPVGNTSYLQEIKLLTSGVEDILKVLDHVKKKFEKSKKNQEEVSILQYQPLIAYGNIVAVRHIDREQFCEEVKKSIISTLRKVKAISALIIVYKYDRSTISFKRTLICNPKAKVPLTDEEKKLINSLEGFQ